MELKNFTQTFKVELYMSSKNKGLNDGIINVDDGHVGVKETNDIFIYEFENIQKKGSRP